MLLLTGAILQAACQFYDSESEVRIYCWHEGNDMGYIAFNFNGDRGAILASSNVFSGTKQISLAQIAENPNILKERVFEPNLRIMDYDSTDTGHETYKLKTTITLGAPGYVGNPYDWSNPFAPNIYFTKFQFSYSGYSLNCSGYNISSKAKQKTLDKVSVDELLNIYSEIEDEKERRARWR